MKKTTVIILALRGVPEPAVVDLRASSARILPESQPLTPLHVTP